MGDFSPHFTVKFGLIYIDDIQYCLCDSNLHLFVRGKTVVKANACIEALQLWFLANRLSLNLVKTSYSVFGDHNVSDDFELKTGATVLKRVTSYKYLGIIIDDKLTWKVSK